MHNKIILFAAAPIAAGIALFFTLNPTFFTSANSSPQSPTVPAATQQIVLDPKVTYNDIIPATNYTARKYKDVGLQYPPVAVANKCLFYFSYARNETAWAYGVYVADWFAERGQVIGDAIAFPYDFDWKAYNLTAGWKSALGQSKVAECFLGAYAYSGNEKYLTLAKQSLLYLKVPTSEGGVMIDEGDNRWWYEEYPSEGGSYVLNGDQFVLIALSKYLDVHDDRTIRDLLDNGLRALKADALLYDNGTNNSFYDRLGGPAKQYHPTHIANFQKLYEITKDEDWLNIKKAFEE